MGKKSRMFEFVDQTWNPIGARCPFQCVYCWAQSANGLINRYKLKKYFGKPVLYEKTLNQKFKDGETVFVGDMTDIFAPNVPDTMILRVLYTIKKWPETTFLLLTKNPLRYKQIRSEYGDLPKNILLGATIESNRNYPNISRAPSQEERLRVLADLSFYYPDIRLFVSIEPILDFDLDTFTEILKHIAPYAVAVGYDNYGNKLPEPPLEKTEALIKNLEYFTPFVYRKTIRRAWNE